MRNANVRELYITNPEPPCQANKNTNYCIIMNFFLPGLRRVRSPSRVYKYFMNNIWQDAGTRTWLAATAVRCATNELNTVYFRTISVKCFSRYTVLSISVMNLSALLLMSIPGRFGCVSEDLPHPARQLLRVLQTPSPLTPLESSHRKIGLTF